MHPLRLLESARAAQSANHTRILHFGAERKLRREELEGWGGFEGHGLVAEEAEVAFRMSYPPKAIYDEGAVTFWCGHGPFHLRMLPPLPVIEMDMWPRIFEVIERGLARAAG